MGGTQRGVDTSNPRVTNTKEGRNLTPGEGNTEKISLSWGKKKKKHNSSPHSTHLTIKEAQMEEAVYSQGVTSRVGMGR